MKLFMTCEYSNVYFSARQTFIGVDPGRKPTWQITRRGFQILSAILTQAFKTNKHSFRLYRLTNHSSFSKPDRVRACWGMMAVDTVEAVTE